MFISGVGRGAGVCRRLRCVSRWSSLLVGRSIARCSQSFFDQFRSHNWVVHNECPESLVPSILHLGNTLIWTDAALRAFQDIEDFLSDVSALFHPDHHITLVLRTDAFDTSIGAVMGLPMGGEWCRFGIFIHTLTAIKCWYSIFSAGCHLCSHSSLLVSH